MHCADLNVEKSKERRYTVHGVAESDMTQHAYVYIWLIHFAVPRN